MGVIGIVIILIMLVATGMAHAENISYYNSYESFTRKLGRFVSYNFIGFIIGCVVSLFVLSIGGQHKKGVYDKTITHELVSLGDGSTTNGEFMLGCGSIDNEMYYSYYRREVDGDGIIRKRITAKLTTIYEVDSLEIPYMDVEIVTGNEFKDDWFYVCGNQEYQKYKIYIPTGSIVKDINLDNK